MSMFRVRQFQMSKEVASQTSEGYPMPQITKKRTHVRINCNIIWLAYLPLRQRWTMWVCIKKKMHKIAPFTYIKGAHRKIL